MKYNNNIVYNNNIKEEFYITSTLKQKLAFLNF